MTTTTVRPTYAPRTRAGLLISCSGFGALAATTFVPALTADVGGGMSLGFVSTIVAIVFVPRLIPVGPSWPRTELPRRFATVVFFVSAVSALVAVTAGGSSGALAWSWVSMAVILAGVITVAVLVPPLRE